MQPNFLIIGAAKAATTNIAHLISQHPDIFISDPKEPFFFSRPEVWAEGWEWYESCFDGWKGESAVGEASTDYSQTGTSPECLPRIVEHLPDAKLVYIMRDPLKSVESFWVERAAKWKTKLPFNEAIRHDPVFVDSRSYWKQYCAYRHHYPEDRILLLFFEDFVGDPDSVVSDIFRFLDVDDSVNVKEHGQYVNARDSKQRTGGWLITVKERWPVVWRAYMRIPGAPQQLIRRAIKRPFAVRPAWDEEVRQWFLDEIREDALGILRHCGKPPTFWTLE